MNPKLSDWLKKKLAPRREQRAMSPLRRQMVKLVWGLLLLGLILGAVWRVVLFVEVNRHLSWIRAEGLPLSGAELNTWLPAVADAENGALVLTQAFALAPTVQDSRFFGVAARSLLHRTSAWGAETNALVAACVKTNLAALERARQALRFSRFRFPADYSYGPDTELPHLGGLKTLGRVAALQAVLEANQGQTNQWPELIRLQLQLADTLEGEPVLVSCLVRSRLIHEAILTMQRGLNQGDPGASECARLETAFKRAAATNTLPLALIGERAMLLPAFRLSRHELNLLAQDSEAGRPRTPLRFSGKPAFFLWLSGFFERDLDFFLQTMQQSILLSEKAPPESLQMTNCLQKATTVANRRFYVLCGLLLPAEVRVVVHETTLQANLRLAISALAVEQFRHAHGKLPDGLRELTPEFLPEVPKDPFDGAPLRYQRRARGYVLYSIGAEGHDDGGQEPPEWKQASDKTSYDITFTVER